MAAEGEAGQWARLSAPLFERVRNDLQQLAPQVDAGSLPEEHLYISLPDCAKCKQLLDGVTAGGAIHILV